MRPPLDQSELENQLQELKSRLPQPVIWLIGKAQSGKTSIVHALMGNSRAVIGNGVEPCTHFSRRYPFPSKDFPLLEFLDTRGLDDPRYDPAEDLAWHEEQAHLVMVVMRAMDPGQTVVRSVLEKIVRRHPEWPIIVVHTCLHEGYPWREPRHILPYPFAQETLSPEVPQDLARAIAFQRSWFTGKNVRFVAIDFTLPEDGFQPQFYGLEQLWQTMEEVFPLGVLGIVKRSRELRQQLNRGYDEKVNQTILNYALLAAASAVVPIPGADLPLIMGIQFTMAQAIAEIYKQQFTWDRFVDILGTLGWSFVTRLGVPYVVRELLKFFPWIGIPAAAAFTGISTFALGQVLAWYFSELREGSLPQPENLRQVFKEELETARKHLSGLFERARDLPKN